MTGLPVVVGYNGRPHSRDALLWAAAEADRRGEALLVVYAANYPGMTLDTGPGMLDPDPEALEAPREVTLRGIAEAQAAHPELRVTGQTEVTSPAAALIEKSRQAELLVIGTRGRGPVTSGLLGSVAFAVSAWAACPVVVVKNETRGPLGGPERRIVVGTDGSIAANAAVAFAADRATESSATLDVITCTGEHFATGVNPAELRTSATLIAESAADQLRASHPALTVTTRVDDCPAEKTLVEASAGADLVVVGTRGRGAFAGMLLGSVSHAVIYGARCHVAVVEDPVS